MKQFSEKQRMMLLVGYKVLCGPDRVESFLLGVNADMTFHDNPVSLLTRKQSQFLEPFWLSEAGFGNE
jgi:hypothetical protein